jgi:hypothetical protein
MHGVCLCLPVLHIPVHRLVVKVKVRDATDGGGGCFVAANQLAGGCSLHAPCLPLPPTHPEAREAVCSH